MSDPEDGRDNAPPPRRKTAAAGAKKAAPRKRAAPAKTAASRKQAAPAVEATSEMPMVALVEPRPDPVAGPVGEPLLVCQGIDMAYGSVQILFDVDFEVREHEIVALLGTNGAGKSTLLKGVCGLVRPTAGKVYFKGEDITKLPADVTARRGVSLMPGGKGVFPTLSVDENLRLASWLIRDDRERIAAAKEEVLDLFPVLAERHNQMAGNLSGGEQQMLALGSALMTRPELLMIDELSLGLAPTIVGQLLEVVREVHRRGTTIVIVEQSVNVALQLAERAVFMEKGEVRFEGPASDLLDPTSCGPSSSPEPAARRRRATARRHPTTALHRPPRSARQPLSAPPSTPPPAPCSNASTWSNASAGSLPWTTSTSGCSRARLSASSATTERARPP
jgi:ABC-type branched-subunit amino acid transport system ATPase component